MIVDPASGLIEFFGERVPASVEQSWGRGCDHDQVMGQAEIAPLVVSAILWADVLRERQVIAVVDNDSAKDAAIRGYSPSLPSAFLVAALWKALAAANATPWFDRVPGPSNIADGPSRLDFKALEDLGGKRRRLELEHWFAVDPSTATPAEPVKPRSSGRKTGAATMKWL